MALALPWLSAAVVLAMNGPSGVQPFPPLVEAVVAGAINATAEILAARRGVRGGRPLVVSIVDRPHMHVAVDALSPVPGSATAGEARSRAALHERLGLSEPTPHEHQASASADVSGLYDPAAQRIFVGDWIDLASSRFAVSRDVAQAVLDRRFDLSRWLLAASAGRRPGDADTDAFLARQALVEGDATTQALEHLDPDGILPPPRALAALAERTRATILGEQAGAPALALGRRLFIQLDGLMFVARIRGRAPWTAVDDVWRRPPRSTEQILHPEKYDRQEGPDDVGARLPAQLRGGWRTDYGDTLGELGARQFLAHAVDDYRAERAAAGWGGDRALWLRRGRVRASDARSAAGSVVDLEAEGVDAGDDAGGDAGFAAWITTWDDETDAQDFAGQASSALVALGRGVPAPALDARAPVVPDSLRVVDGDGRLYALERRQRTVGMLFAAPPDGEPVLAQLMSAATAHPKPRQARRHAGRVRSR